MSCTFAIGDIHGCRRELVDLLGRITPDPDLDTLVILGDFINRGPDSRGTLEELLILRRHYRHLVILRGNHEQMLLDYLAEPELRQEFFLTVGGRELLASYGVDPDAAGRSRAWLPPDHRLLLEELPLLYENEHAFYVHAGMQPGVHPTRQNRHWLLWARQEFLETTGDFAKPVVFGHTPFAEPLVTADKIGIDTGVVYGGRLTCLVLPEQGFISVPAATFSPSPRLSCQGAARL